MNLPVSVVLTPWLVTHYNAGATLVPRARSPLGDRAASFGANLGASAIFLATPTLNVLLEGLWLREEIVVGRDLTDGQESAYLSPGFRFAINTRGGLQVVPGFAYSIGVGPSAGNDFMFFYFSLEHGFRRAR
jgi:hypothetical protein